jgi:hypothetical protein
MRTPLILATLLCAARLGALSLDDIATDKALWTTSRDVVATKTGPLQFRWTSAAKDALRATKGGTIIGLDAGETILRFPVKGDAPSMMEISLYNRGDRGEMSVKDFAALIDKATAAVSEVAKTKPQEIKFDKTAVVKADGAVWAGKDATYHLEWNKFKGAQGRQPEFIKLRILPPGKASTILSSATAGNVDPSGSYKAAEHLETNPEGDKWIRNVPMVDQGQKGYCAVATTERVLRLYGLTIDEHQIAQIAGSTAEGGTSYSGLADSLKANSGRLKVRMKSLIETNEKYFAEFVTDYNKAAKKTKATPLGNPHTQAFYSSFSFEKLDGPTLLAGRGKNDTAIRRFERDVAEYINRGIPVIWGVSLGYVPETPALPQAKGGHMRLIIGYNAKNHAVIYSDSWGAGHERKTMSADKAFAITTGMMVLEP